MGSTAEETYTQQDRDDVELKILERNTGKTERQTGGGERGVPNKMAACVHYHS